MELGGVGPGGVIEPAGNAEADPEPPSPADAARILREASRGPDWATMIWLAMTTGARRGELCALRLPAVDLTDGRASVRLRRGLSEGESGWAEGDLKSHQQRRIALDAETVLVLEEHIARRRVRCVDLEIELMDDAFIFAPAFDGSTFLTPKQ